jgi:hypothetical protein
MTQKPHTYVADIAHLPTALAHITKQKRFVIWRWEKRVKKNGEESFTKPPYQCGNPTLPAKSNNPNTWGSYEAAIVAVAAGLADGIGFMLKDSDVAAADLDHVRDAQTGEIIGWAQRLCVEADSLGLYREVTVSGCGLRFIGLAQLPAQLDLLLLLRALRPGRRSRSSPANCRAWSTRPRMRCCCSAAISISVAAC